MHEISDEIIHRIIFFLVILIPVLGVQVSRVYLSPEIEAFVDGRLIYKGREACVHVSSGGYATTIKTDAIWSFCFLPDKSYTSKDVIVRTVDE